MVTVFCDSFGTPFLFPRLKQSCMLFFKLPRSRAYKAAAVFKALGVFAGASAALATYLPLRFVMA